MSQTPRTRNVLITGSSRGLGLEFVHQYLASPDTHVIATARHLDQAKALQELTRKHSNLTLLEVDVSSPESVRAALKALPPLSLLINNAGIFVGLDGVNSAPIHDVLTTFNTNVAGALITIQAALPALQQAAAQSHIRPVVVNMSSDLGSIQLATTRQVMNGTGSLASAKPLST